jgi:predicted nucleotide-binding protein
LWRRVGEILSRRLLERNKLIRLPNERIRVFLISSSEAIRIAREVENQLRADPFITVVWAEGVFRVSNYTLESLEEQLELSDFAVAIAHHDDLTEFREKKWPTPRDNVVFELGFFMGRLGRNRAILMEPREARVKLPSDLAGVTTIPYHFEKGHPSLGMGPACNELREHINGLGRLI